MMNLVTAFPFIVGGLLILIGAAAAVYRIKGHIHTEGVITDTARTVKRKSRVTVNMEAPVVKYKINGIEYHSAAYKFMADGILDLSRGKTIKIRVNRRDHRRFVPEESGGIAEKLLIGGGVSMIIANIVILLRYGS